MVLYSADLRADLVIRRPVTDPLKQSPAALHAECLAQVLD